MITKPEHAIPNCSGAAHNMLLDETCKGIEFPPWFTGSECAEIARAYASALHASEFNPADAAIDAAKWESKFKEWETK